MWDHAVQIYAGSTVAAALKLLIHDFSAEMPTRIVQERSDLLEAALEVFRPEIRQRYIPQADDYVATTNREAAEANQDQLRKRVAEQKRAQAPSTTPQPTSAPPAESAGSGDAT